MDPRYDWKDIGGIPVVRPRIAWRDPHNPLNQPIRVRWADEHPARLLKRISDIECDRQARGLVLERLERPQDRQSVLDQPPSPDVE